MKPQKAARVSSPAVLPPAVWRNRPGSELRGAR